MSKETGEIKEMRCDTTKPTNECAPSEDSDQPESDQSLRCVLNG